jgi:hypothetical protein
LSPMPGAQKACPTARTVEQAMMIQFY